MSTLTPFLKAWDDAHWEFSLAFKNLSDEDLWRRADPRLLSVGELAAHVGYWQAIWVLGNGQDKPDVSQLGIQSPLLDHAFRYYTGNVDHPMKLDLGTAEVLEELRRIHEASKVTIGDKGLDDVYEGNWKTWGNLVQYQVFHVAYHTGQAYSVRHLMGHETEDN